MIEVYELGTNKDPFKKKLNNNEKWRTFIKVLISPHDNNRLCGPN